MCGGGLVRVGVCGKYATLFGCMLHCGKYVTLFGLAGCMVGNRPSPEGQGGVPPLQYFSVTILSHLPNLTLY